MSTLNVVVPQPTGVCSGVANALNALKELREKHPAARIFTNHQTVHHGAADAILEENDIAVVDPADLQYLQPGDLVVGSAHGTPQWEIDAIHRRGARFWDTACPLVSANSGWIANPRNNVVVYVGKPGHREFEAAVNRARGAHCFVVDLHQESIDEVVSGVRKIGRILPVVLIRQTTIPGNDANVLRIRQALQGALPGFPFPGDHGECYATQNRQVSLVRGIEEWNPQAVLVLTAENSSNGMALVRTAELQAQPVFYGEYPEDLIWKAEASLEQEQTEVVLLVAAASVISSVLEGAVSELCSFARVRGRECKVVYPWLVDAGREPTFKPLTLS